MSNLKALPPKKVDYTRSEPSTLSFVTKAPISLVKRLSIIREFTEDIRMHRVATRILKELVMTPIVLKDLKKLRAQLRIDPLDSLQQNPSTVTTSD